MDVIRLLKGCHYDRRLRRFQSVAFRPSSSDGGISVIDAECIQRSGASVCEHVRRYYQRENGDPAIFWTFSTEILPACHCLEHTDSTAGDACHYNILGMSTTRARTFFKNSCVPPDALSICNNGTHRPLSWEDVEG